MAPFASELLLEQGFGFRKANVVICSIFVFMFGCTVKINANTLGQNAETFFSEPPREGTGFSN